jgi:hypothetical protein
MNLLSRVQKLEEELGIVVGATIRRIIFIGYGDDEECDIAKVCVDGREQHFKRAAGETSDDFKARLMKIPWGMNTIRVIYLLPEGPPAEPVPRENGPPEE